MATLLEAWNLRFSSSSLKNRVVAAVAKKAIDVLVESPATTNHANRVIWANAALRDAMGRAEEMMWAVIADAAILAAGEGSTDAQILTAVGNAIDTFATG